VSADPIDEAVREIQRAEALAEDMVRGVGVDSLVLPCVKAYALNSVALPLASRICRGESVDTERLVLRVGKALSSRIGVLTAVCTVYRGLISDSLGVVADIGCGLGLNLGIVEAYTAIRRLRC